MRSFEPILSLKEPQLFVGGLSFNILYSFYDSSGNQD